jgi:hypothetical protein
MTSYGGFGHYSMVYINPIMCFESFVGFCTTSKPIQKDYVLHMVTMPLRHLAPRQSSLLSLLCTVLEAIHLLAQNG